MKAFIELIISDNGLAKSYIMKYTFYLIVYTLVVLHHVSAETINYKQVLADALGFSQKLSEAKLDRDIKESVLKEAAYLKYPELSLKIYSEHVNDLAGDSGLTSVGGTILADSSKFQNTAYIDVSYSLFDYGIRNNRVKVAEIDWKAAQVLVRKTKMDIELNVLNIYSDIQICSIDLSYNNQILELMKLLNKVRERTGDAGLLDRLDILDRSMEVQKIEGEVTTHLFRLSALLEDLRVHTGMKYNQDFLVVEPLVSDIQEIETIDFRKLPEFQYYEYLYSMKTTEFEIEKKKFFPSLELYIRYSFYGMDDHDYLASFDEMREKNFTTGIYTVMPLMENFKRRHTLSRLNSERQRAAVVMDEKFHEFQVLYEKIKTNYLYYQKVIDQKQKMLALVREKLDMVTRLTDAKVMDLEPGLEQKITLIRQELDLEKQIVEKTAALKQISIQCEGAK